MPAWCGIEGPETTRLTTYSGLSSPLSAGLQATMFDAPASDATFHLTIILHTPNETIC